MDILRTEMVARALAAVIAASFVFVAFGPVLTIRSERADVLSAWVSEKLDGLGAGELAAVMHTLAASGGRDSGAADFVARGMSLASAEELARVLHDFFGRSIREALMPRLFLTAAQGAVVSVASRVLSGVGAGSIELRPPVLFQILPVAAESGFRPAFETLSAARPLGP